MLTALEKENLKTLAKKYAEIAWLPAQQERIELWKALNRGAMKRPMIVFDQLPWHELNDDGSLTLTTEDPFWRGMENFMRMTIYKWNRFSADMVVEPVLPVPMAVAGAHYGIHTEEENIATDSKNDVVSHRYHNQLVNDEDVLKIKDMDVKHDEDETERRLNEAEDLFNGIIQVRPKGVIFHLGSWDKISTMMGVTQAYTDLVDRPEFIHKIMRRFTDATLKGIGQINKLKAYDCNENTCHCSYVYTDDLLPGVSEGRGMETENSWAFGLAQLFSSVSPAMTEEFEFPYISELAAHFGGIYYGCCDRLDDRIDLVKQIPNVKKVSCSPWSVREAFAERLGGGLVMSAKPSPAFIAGSAPDYKTVASDLTRTVKAAEKYNVRLEIILKDISTVNYEPERLTEWSKIAASIVGGA